ncbi:MAG: hypothetical protein ACERKD_03130 [Prolixibacteraceae bacterium]
MKQLVLFLCLFALLISCKKDATNNYLEVSIDNQSSFEMTNIKLYSNIGVINHNFTDSLLIEEIKSGDSFDTSWNLKDLVSVDGGFVISFIMDTIQNQKDFGYFSNGIIIGKSYNIQIKDDIIKITKAGN